MLGKTEGRSWRAQQRMRWLDGITDSVDMSFKQNTWGSEGQGMCHIVVHGVTTSLEKLCDNNKVTLFIILIFFFFRNLSAVFHDDINLHIYKLHKWSHFSTSSLTLVSCLFDNSHGNMYELRSYCDFNLHLSD